MLSFTVALDRNYVKQGEERQADFITCVAWDKTAEFVAKFFEDEMKGICRLGKFDNGDSWYFSLGDVTVDHELPSLQTWAREFLPGAIG